MNAWTEDSDPNSTLGVRSWGRLDQGGTGSGRRWWGRAFRSAPLRGLVVLWGVFCLFCVLSVASPSSRTGSPGPRGHAASEFESPGVRHLAALAGKSKLTVTVVDGDTGRAVAGARVLVNVMIAPGNFKTVELATDAQGQCVVKILPAEFRSAGISVLKDGFRPRGTKLTPQTAKAAVTLQLARIILERKWAGRVFQPDGQPAAEAQGAIYPEGQAALGLEGTPANAVPTLIGPMLRRFETANDGSFNCPGGPFDEGILLLHPTGYRRLSWSGMSNANRVVLKPWGVVEGSVKVGAGVVANRRLTLWCGHLSQPDNLGFVLEGKSDEQGRFRFAQVPEGPCWLGFSRFEAKRTWSGRSHAVRLQGRSGEAVSVQLGGGGRLVTGKLKVEGEDPSWQRMAFALVKREALAPAAPAKTVAPAAAPRQKQESESTEPRYYLDLAEDGTFRVEDVPPGEYRVWVDGGGAGGDWQRRLLGVAPEHIVRFVLGPAGPPVLEDDRWLDPTPAPAAPQDGLPTVVGTATDLNNDPDLSERPVAGWLGDEEAPEGAPFGARFGLRAWAGNLEAVRRSDAMTNVVTIPIAPAGQAAGPFDLGTLDLRPGP